MKAIMAPHQLDTPEGDLPGYEVARQMTAKVLRRMLGTSSRTSPILLFMETRWELPDQEIIKEKLNFHARMAQRADNEEQSKQKRTGADKDWFDGATHVWQARIKQVDDGEDTGICAEAKRLWAEAGMSNYWSPPVNKLTKRRAQRPINMEAEIIAITRPIETAHKGSDVDGDTPYMELYDGTTWRLTNGERDEVGLMTSARLGALMTNAGRPADGELLDPTCPCCGHGHERAEVP
jgi:hypothetical protein